jgi:excisionase family DNA binding protein
MHFDTSTGLAPITCSVKAAVAATGLGKDTIYKMMDEGRLESATVGGRRLVFVNSLQTYLESCRMLKGGAA